MIDLRTALISRIAFDLKYTFGRVFNVNDLSFLDDHLDLVVTPCFVYFSQYFVNLTGLIRCRHDTCRFINIICVIWRRISTGPISLVGH